MRIKLPLKKNKQEKTVAIIRNIGELHEKYIKLFIDLYTHISVVDDNFYLAAQKALTEQYQAELELCIAEAAHSYNEKLYLAESRNAALGIYSYRHWFRRKNSPMKQVLDEYTAREAEGYLSELYEALEPAPVEEKRETEEPIKPPSGVNETAERCEADERQAAGKRLIECLKACMRFKENDSENYEEDYDLEELYDIEEDFEQVEADEKEIDGEDQ